MNIFVLDLDPKVAAEHHCDKHVVKMILEYGQMLSTSHRLLDAKLVTAVDPEGNVRPKKFWLYENETPRVAEVHDDDGFTWHKWVIDNPRCYMVAHASHPCSVWARETSTNYMWLFRLFEASLAEYTRRYRKKHTAERLTEFLRWAPNNIKPGKLTPFALAMPDEYKQEDAVAAYRAFYIGAKSRFAKWRFTEQPEWYKIGVENGRTN